MLGVKSKFEVKIQRENTCGEVEQSENATSFGH